jgi:membrane protein
LGIHGLAFVFLIDLRLRPAIGLAVVRANLERLQIVHGRATSNRLDYCRRFGTPLALDAQYQLGNVMTSDHLPQSDPQHAFDVVRQMRRLCALEPRHLGTLVLDTFNEWSADNAGRLGAALAYYTLFSIAPILIVVMGVVGLVYGPSAAQGQIAPWLEQFLGSEGARAAQFMVARASSPAGGVLATVVGIVSLFLGASAVVNELRNSLNIVWRVSSPATQTTDVLAAIRDLFSARLYAFAVVFGAGVVSVFGIFAATLIAALGAHFRAWLPLPEAVLQAVSFIVAMALTTTMFTLVYKTVPDASISWGDAVIGAMVTALLFNLGGVLLSMFVGKTAASVYGAAGSVIALLVWVYYSAQVFFFGAELTRIFANRFGGRVIPRPHMWRSVLRQPMHPV